VKRLVVTADDFGASRAINEAVETAHREGILTSASLMAGEAFVDDAVERARRMPTLGVGLHVALTNARPVLSPTLVPDLVDADGYFDSHLVRAGVRYFAVRRARAQLRAEIRAQFEAFAATGLPLDHVNSHNHMHVHPTIFTMLYEIGTEFGMRAMRVPFEPRYGSLAGIGNALLFAPWAALMRERLERAGILSNDAIFGLNDTARLDEARTLAIVEQLPGGLNELYCHPRSEEGDPGACSAARHARAQELYALCSPRVRAAIARENVALVTFSQAAQAAAGELAGT
jgi:hopanoid biosynthesis associated protein HpnK